MGCLSTPTASIPVYMMETQPSLLDKTKRAMRAWPRLSKLYWELIHWLPGRLKQSSFVLTLARSPTHLNILPLNSWKKRETIDLKFSS